MGRVCGGHVPCSARDGPRGMKRPIHSRRPDVGDLPIDDDVDKEVDFHLDMRTKESIDQGWAPSAA